MKDCQRLSRRAALGGMALGAAMAATTSSAAAQQKISQMLAKYQGAPKGDRDCASCVSFEAPNGCKFVQGDISPHGWCQLFSRRPA